MTTQSASAAAKHFLTQFRSLSKFAEEVAALGDIEAQSEAAAKAKVEADKDLGKVRDDVTAAKKQLVVAVEETKLAQAAAKQAVSEANARASEIVGKAKYEATDLVAKARAEADAILTQARDGASDAANNALALGKEIKARQAELDSINRELDSLRRKIA